MKSSLELTDWVDLNRCIRTVHEHGRINAVQRVGTVLCVEATVDSAGPRCHPDVWQA